MFEKNLNKFYPCRIYKNLDTDDIIFAYLENNFMQKLIYVLF